MIRAKPEDVHVRTVVLALTTDLNGNRYPLSPGVLYVLNDHDEHYLRGGDNKDLVLVSVFNPPLKGPEKHDLSRPDSSY